jgi:glycosyltransferase involved in cell wall biosynthesis
MADTERSGGLTGQSRQKVAEDLWAASQPGGRGASLITGISGAGKSDRLVRPLLDRARAQGRIAVHVEVPESPLSADAELSALIVQELRYAGHGELASACEQETGFPAVARRALRHGALLVVDEFQRLLEPDSALPFPSWRSALSKIATRASDGGCLWLVANREVAPDWSEPFHIAVLQPPSLDADQIGIVVEALASEDAETRFPIDRRIEVVRRLGGNPRALRLLGNLLRTHALEDMFGPTQPALEDPVDPALVDKLEQQMVARAAEGLAARPRVLLAMLTTLPDPAPWPLVEAVACTEPGHARQDAAELQSRYLLDARGSRYAVHPVVREVLGPQLRADAGKWAQAHLRAGRWQAQTLGTAIGRSPRDAELALALSGARYHLMHAGAHDELKYALVPVQRYIESRYGWSPTKLATEAECDGAIDLLRIFLESPGKPGVEFTYAKLLWARDRPGDAERALPHAQRATDGQDFSHPWLLWAKLVRETQGIDAAVQAAKQATAAVAPEKSLFSVYQFLGACLSDLGRVAEAVDVLLSGAEFSRGNNARLHEEALLLAAASSASSLLQHVRDRLAERGSASAPQLALADVLLLEQQGRWHDATALASSARFSFPTLLHLCHHEAIARLGAGDPGGADAAMRSFPIPFRAEPRNGNQWLLSLIAARNSDIATAAHHFRIYMNATDVAGPLSMIEAALLREWDHRVGTVGEANPALIAPILPASVTGLAVDVRRPQHGPPVLPRHGASPALAPELRSRGPAILVIATEWQSGRGGLSTLNRNLCRALAHQGAEVVCVVAPDADPATDTGGVRVIAARRTPGMDPHEALARRPELPDGFAPDLIIGHGRITGPAAKALSEDHFPDAQRLHLVHMAADEIEWLKPGREDDAAQRAEDRSGIELALARGAAGVIAIGPRLHGRFLRDLQAVQLPDPIRLDPGFDSDAAPQRQPPGGRPWAVLVMGRMEDAELKGLDIAANAMGRVAADKRISETLELIVRGASEGSGEATRLKVTEWAASPALSVLVRPYTAETERLDADLRRASLLLMPSRAEGFGLVGLEAILAGTPVLVSEQSGLGMLLQEVLAREAAARHVVVVTGDLQADAGRWSRAIEGILLDRDAAFRRAAELRVTLARQRTWSSATSTLLAEFAQAPERRTVG